MVLEAIEVSRPELAVGGQPVVELYERLGPDPVQAVQIGLHLRHGRRLAVAGHVRLRLGGNFLPGQEASYERLLDRLEQTGLLNKFEAIKFKPDAAPPAVALTAPAGGATVTGSVTVSAAASDNVGVAGVQFKLDGANLGAEVTSAPYSV